MIRAIYDNGVFRPLGPVDLPDRTEVEIDARPVHQPGDSDPAAHAHLEEPERRILEILYRSYDTGHTDTAARIDELQP